jgi:acetyl esterase/lipase
MRATYVRIPTINYHEFGVIRGDSLGHKDCSLPAFEYIFVKSRGSNPLISRSIQLLEGADEKSILANSAIGAKRRVVLFFHGGAFCVGNRSTSRSVMCKMAEELDVDVLSVEYRLAPEHRHPAAGEDCFNAYKWLLEAVKDPTQILFAGESAGGALAVDVLLAVREAGLAMPAGAILLSPWVDLFDSWRPSMVEFAQSDLLPPQSMPFFAGLYTTPPPADWQPPSSPSLSVSVSSSAYRSVSAVHQELHGLPPLLLECGEREVFRDQILYFAEKARRDGAATVECNVYPQMAHCFQSFHAMKTLTACRDSFDNMKAFVQRLR